MNCLVFQLSENSGSYYSPMYPCLMNGTISAKTEGDISLSEKKDGTLEHSAQPWQNNVGTWLSSYFCPTSSCSDVCKAVDEKRLNKQETSFNKKIHHHGEDNTSVQLKGQNQILTLLSSLLFFKSIPTPQYCEKTATATFKEIGQFTDVRCRKEGWFENLSQILSARDLSE